MVCVSESGLGTIELQKMQIAAENTIGAINICDKKRKVQGIQTLPSKSRNQEFERGAQPLQSVERNQSAGHKINPYDRI